MFVLLAVHKQFAISYRLNLVGHIKKQFRI